MSTHPGTRIHAVAEAISKVLGESVTVMTPKFKDFGDYSVNVMQLAEKPSQDQIMTYVTQFSTHPLFSKAEQKGAFINLFMSKEALHDDLVEVLEKVDTYGSSNWGEGQTWEIEHTSPNPNKAMHLGHLRNNVTGMAIARIWEFVGLTVIKEAVDNNRGIAIARLMWGFLKYAAKESVNEKDKTLQYWFDHTDEWHTPESAEKDPGKFIDELYVKASADFKDSEEIQKEVRKMVVDWENSEPMTQDLWKLVMEYSHTAQEKTLERLGNEYDKVWHEHEHYELGKKYVEHGLEKGIFKKTNEGTIITQLEENYNLPDTVVIKSDGTSLYITQDIAMTDLRIKKFKADRMFWVVGPEQALALKQLFAVCEQLGIGRLDQFTHISFGWMSIKGQGSMSSRKGNVIYIDDLLDDAIARAKKLIRNEDLSDEELDKVAEAVGIGAVKYSLLKISRNQKTEFDFETSLSFEGNSGPYIQYSYARMMSLLRKGGHLDIAVVPDKRTELDPSEELLMRTLPRFKEVVLEAAQTYQPHLIASFLFELTQVFNGFYENSPVLDASADVKDHRLSLIKATSQVVKNGLRLLGVDVVERM